MEGESCLIKTRIIPKDGNCLYTAIVHQLYGNDNDLPEIMNLSKKLRAQIVAYISENFSTFKLALEQHVFDEFRVDSDDTEEKCKEIISKLSRDGCWGGHESLVAATMLFNINILIVYEGGYFIYNEPFDMNRKRTILLAYRKNKNSIQHTHYESILHINQNDVYTMTKMKSNTDPVETIEV